jgi:Cu(I)/Ag(I) efflux system membrane fusion protein
VLGPRAGDYYVVESGLTEGEMVVVNGAFKIDSSMQIQAKPSMMSPEGGVPAPGHDFGASREFQAQLGLLYDEYLAFVSGLAADNAESARTAAARLFKALEAVDMGQLTGEAHMAWMGLVPELQSAAEAVANADHMEALRASLPALTTSVATAIRSFGIGEGTSVLRFHCPMAFDGAGADWLQSTTATANPYFGSAMPGCGELVETMTDEEHR